MKKVNITVKDHGNGDVLLQTDFEATGRFSYLSYGKKLAEVLSPYLEDGPLVDLDVNIDDGSNVLCHQMETFKSTSGFVVHDKAPLAMNGVFSTAAKVPFAWLDFVNAEWNNNKFYSLDEVPGDPTQCAARYGRIGDAAGSKWASHAQKPFLYPVYMYYLKLTEKGIKGYEDHTKEHAEEDKASVKKLPNVDPLTGISDKDVARLVKALTDYANQTIEDNYSVAVSSINSRAVKKARKTIEKLSAIKKDVAEFNDKLIELMHIIPRKVSSVNDHMAKSHRDFDTIINDESDLLDVLENQIEAQKPKKSKTEAKTPRNILEKLGLEIYPATPEQIGKVKEHLSDNLQPKLKNVYRVINKKTQRRFNSYLKANKRPLVKQFWHGSRNANWWNIICQGLVLHSNAPQTGKMFGYGLYFAPSPTKSWGYTSSCGSYWAHGSSNVAYMGLYATAYGDPYEVLSWERDLGNLTSDSFESAHPGKNCLHAKRDAGMLRNDEVVFYREEQVTINYICEFDA